MHTLSTYLSQVNNLSLSILSESAEGKQALVAEPTSQFFSDLPMTFFPGAKEPSNPAPGYLFNEWDFLHDSDAPTKAYTASTSRIREPAKTPPPEKRRPFPCPFTMYGCVSSFSSKNEWMRHVSDQHIKLGFWRCHLCPSRKDPNNGIVYYKDFNRKDLFIQHVHRMHAAPPHASSLDDKDDEGYPVNEDNLADYQSLCWRTLRRPPQQSSCHFCDRVFVGPGSWSERMEHVGRHLDKDRHEGPPTDAKKWKEDPYLLEYLLKERLIVKGDGKFRYRLV